MAENTRTAAAAMEEFKQTPYYKGLGIEGLQEQLAGYQAGDEALKSQAEAQYRPAYESESEAVRQELEREIQGYGSQRAGVSAAYDRQRRSANQAYDESAVEMNNQLNKRGLGRSSLVSTQGAYLENKRNEALSDIDRAESDAIGAINERIALLTEQAAQKERTLAGNYARQLENRVNELKEQNRSASISLQLQIAALQQQGYEAYQDWLLANRKQEIAEKEFEAEYGTAEKTTGGSSGSGSGGKKTASAGTKKTSAAEKAQTGAAKAGTFAGVIAALTNAIAKGQKSGMAGGSAAIRTSTAAKRRNAME